MVSPESPRASRASFDRRPPRRVGPGPERAELRRPDCPTDREMGERERASWNISPARPAPRRAGGEDVRAVETDGRPELG